MHLKGANSFFVEQTPFQRGGKNKSDRVVSPESVSVPLIVHIKKLTNLSIRKHLFTKIQKGIFSFIEH